MNKELLIEETKNSVDINGEITLEMAAKMVKNHVDKAGEDEATIFTVDRAAIESILSQPGCAGLSFSEAINEDGAKVLVFGGLSAKGNVINEITSIDQSGKLCLQEGKFGTIVSLGGSHTLPTNWWGS